MVDESFDGAYGFGGLKDVLCADVVDFPEGGGRECKGVCACCVKDNAGSDLIEFVEVVPGDGEVDVVVCDARETW